MELLVDFAQTTAGDMSIDFGGADTGVAKQFLDDAQIGSVLQEVSGEAVAQHVRSNPAVAGLDPRAADASLDAQPERYGGERGAAAVPLSSWRLDCDWR